MDERFSGKAGEEYELFSLACPHYRDLQKVVGSAIREYYKSSPLPSIKVLEIGCGSGYTTQIILSSDKRIRVTAIDNEDTMLVQARRNLANFVKQNRVEFVQKDALEYLRSMPNNSFDVFASAFTLHNFSHSYRRGFLREVYRTLKDGGMFVNADKYARDKEHEHQKDLEWQLNKFQKVYSAIKRQDLAREGTGHYKEDNLSDRIMKQSTAINQMKTIGFKKIKLRFRKHMEAVVEAKK